MTKSLTCDHCGTTATYDKVRYWFVLSQDGAESQHGRIVETHFCSKKCLVLSLNPKRHPAMSDEEWDETKMWVQRPNRGTVVTIGNTPLQPHPPT